MKRVRKFQITRCIDSSGLVEKGNYTFRHEIKIEELKRL